MISDQIALHSVQLPLLIHPSRPALSPSNEEWPDPTSPGTHKFMSPHYDEAFGLTQIPQVVMNIDFKLEPIVEKTWPHIFTTWIFILMQNYYITSKI